MRYTCNFQSTHEPAIGVAFVQSGKTESTFMHPIRRLLHTELAGQVTWCAASIFSSCAVLWEAV